MPSTRRFRGKWWSRRYKPPERTSTRGSMRSHDATATTCVVRRSGTRWTIGFVWRVWPAVERAALDRAARLVLGTHDFGAFGSAPRKGGRTVRTVEASAWSSIGRVLSYEIVADGFLYRMVRRLVFLQVAVGQGKCSEQVLGEALRTGRRVQGLPAGTAPADGLTLMEVKY